jgi:hypothetical protein
MFPTGWTLPIPDSFLAQAAAPAASHARFLALMLGLVVVFLLALVAVTVLRMAHRRHASRADRIAKVRTPSRPPVSPWQAAGQRAMPDDGEADADEDDEGDGDFGFESDAPDLDDDDDDADDSGDWSPPPKRG